MNLWNFVVVKEVMTPRHVTLPSRFHVSLINNAPDPSQPRALLVMF